MKNLIKNLRINLPSDAPFDSGQLHAAGVSNALAAKYVASGWLRRLDRGIFQFTGETLDADRTLRFLERRIPSLHLAAKTALDRHGYRHNVSFDETIVVWAEERSRIPEWTHKVLRMRFGIHRLFELDLPFECRVGRLADRPYGPLVSEPEYALLEMLSEVGVSQELDEARGIMESMVRIRPSRIERAIRSCQMVKAVRLCVFWAEAFGFGWSERARAAVTEDKREGRWTGRLRDGSYLTLPAL